MLKILQASLWLYLNQELPDVQDGFRKGRGTRNQIADICWITEKAREFQKNVYFCFINYIKAFDCVDPNKLWKILKGMRIPDHLACLLWNLYVGQKQQLEPCMEQLVQNWERSTTRLYVSPYLFNFYGEYIMWNTALDDSQAGIKIARKNISSFRYVDSTTLMAESEEELIKSLLRVKEESEKVGFFEFNIQIMNIMASGPITSWQIDGERVEAVTDFLSSWAPKSLRMVTAAVKLRDSYSLEGKLWKTYTAY